MSGVKYQVEIEYVATGQKKLVDVEHLSTAKNQLSDVHDQYRSFLTSMYRGSQLTSDFSNGIVEAAAKIEAMKLGFEAVSGVVNFIKDGITGINQELELANIAFAGAFQAGGRARDFNEGLAMSKEMIAEMRKDAAELPGTFSQLKEITQIMSIPALNAGLSARSLEQMASKAMAFGLPHGINANTIGREMAMLIEGDFQRRNRLGQILLADLGPKKFNALSITERVAAMESRFARYKDMFDAYEDTFDAIWTTIQQNIQDFQQMLSGGLFVKIKEDLKEINNWFKNNKQMVADFVKPFTDAFDKIHDKLKSLTVLSRDQNLETFIDRYLGKQGPRGLRDDLFRGLIGLSIPGLGVAGAGVGSGLGATIGGIAGAVLGSIFPVIGTSIGAAGGALVGGAAGGAAGAGAGMFAGVGITGMFSGLFDESSPLHAHITQQWHRIKVIFGSVFDEFIEMWDKIRDPLLNIAEALGSKFLDAIIRVGQTIQAVLSFINTALDSWPLKGILNIFAGKGRRRVHVESGGNYNERASGAFDREGTPVDAQAHNTYINKVEIQVNSNQDPSRIARLTVEELVKLGKNPSRAQNSGRPYFSGYVP